MTMKTALWALLAAGMTIASTATMSAQWIDRETLIRMHIAAAASRGAMSQPSLTAALPKVSKDRASPAGPKTLIGSWVETATFPPEAGRPPLKALVSFHDDNTMASNDQGSVTLDPPSVFSSGTGAWTHLERRTFAYTQFELISDLSGNLVGFLKVRGVYTVSQSGNEYTGNSFAEVLDTDGNVLFSVNVTNAGQRIQVERP